MGETLSGHKPEIPARVRIPFEPTGEVESPYDDLDMFRLTALVRVPGVLNGEGVLGIRTAGRYMVVDLGAVQRSEGMGAILERGYLQEVR